MKVTSYITCALAVFLTVFPASEAAAQIPLPRIGNGQNGPKKTRRQLQTENAELLRQIDSLKSDIEAKIAALRTQMESDDGDAIKNATEELARASHKLAEQLYQQQGQPGGPQPGADAGAAGAGPQAGKADDDVVDADYTEVKK